MTDTMGTMRKIAQSCISEIRPRIRLAKEEGDYLVSTEEAEQLIVRLFANAKRNYEKLAAVKAKSQAKHLSGPRIKEENGRLVIDYTGMVQAIDAEEKVEVKRTVVENERTHAKKRYSDRWDCSETKLFYTALRLFGTDFQMVSICLQNRSRQNVKSKYRKECKSNYPSILYALENQIPLYSEAYSEFVNYLSLLN